MIKDTIYAQQEWMVLRFNLNRINELYLKTIKRCFAHKLDDVEILKRLNDMHNHIEKIVIPADAYEKLMKEIE